MKAGPSPEHTRLVGRLISWIQTDGFEIVCGAYGSLVQCEEVGGYIPDAKGRKLGLNAYGEAKTKDDIDTDHTRDQFRVFSRRVMRDTKTKCPFYIAIPKASERTLLQVLDVLGLRNSPHVRWRAF